ncbi:MAG TPA: acyltransferase family protein [Bacteroidota bacterium]|nr:acyltransferase family protein [Bacteroidota bacterium]
MNTTTTERRIDLDWLRVIAFGILIFFHAGMMFNTWGWHVKNNITTHTPEFFMNFLHQWRMPLLFFISGSAAWFLLQKMNIRRFAGNRMLRLFLPLAFGMFVIIPPQVYYERLFQGHVYASFVDFYRTVLQFESYPKGNFSWHHLWYIPYIFVYSFLILPVFGVMRTAHGKARITAFIDWSSRGTRIGLWFIPLAITQLALRPFWMHDANNLVSDWANFAWCFTFFGSGFLLASHHAIWDAIAAQRTRFLTAAILALATIEVVWEVQKDFGTAGFIVYFILKSYHAWLWIVTILGYARAYLTRKNRFLSWANEAVYPFYILHQTITVVLAYYLSGWQIDIFAKYLLVAGGTIAGCYILYEGVIRRVAPLRFVFGMKARKRQPQRMSTPGVDIAAIESAQ